mgnify:FL=1
MLKKKLLLALAVLSPSYSYSDSITPYYGYTGNAASTGLSWSMGNVLPEPPGLDINGVIYSYTIQKEVDDSVDVHVQNENALGSGYIFRETDSWEPGSLGGTQINKNVPVIPGIPRAAWGDGSIVTEGDGSVSDATVIYTYKVDPCYDTQYDPNCPGYKVPVPDIPEVDLASLYDTVSDENVTLDRNVDGELIDDEDKDKKSEEELAEEEAEEKEDRENRLEKALSAVDNSELFAQSFVVAQILESINASTNMNTYYAARISGGTYTDTIVLQDKQLPDSNNGLRNGLAQQLLHEQMIDEQYNK